jgi:uncharacterized protein (DUF2342 family)
MSTALAIKPASIMRTYTQQVRDHSAAMQRLQDQYFAALKRAEAVYFEGVKRVTEALTEATEPVDDAPVEETSSQPEVAATDAENPSRIPAAKKMSSRSAA